MATFDELQLYRRRLLDRYREQADEMAAWASRLSLPQSVPSDPAEDWTQHQLLAHVRDAEVQAYLPRLGRILQEQAPVFEDFDAEAWMKDHYDPHEPAEEIATAFASARTQGWDWLSGLAGDGWNRIGCHPLVGDKTLQWWVERAVAHAQEHLNDQTRDGPVATEVDRDV